MGMGKGMKGGVIEFAPQITLKTFDGFVELGFDESVEFNKCGKRFRFEFQWVNPNIVCEIFNKNKIVFVARFARDRGGP